MGLEKLEFRDFRVWKSGSGRSYPLYPITSYFQPLHTATLGFPLEYWVLFELNMKHQPGTAAVLQCTKSVLGISTPSTSVTVVG
jgi:hypothetical protein